MAIPGVGITLPDQFATKLYEVEGLSSSPDNDIYPLFNAEIRVQTVDIDCTANTGEDVFVKFYNNAAPTVGTTVAHMVLWGKAGVVTSYPFGARGIDFPGGIGTTFCSVACVKEAGAEDGTTAPSGQVDVKVLATGAAT